ncbi:GNAT family N-acetyltransferase [Clostridium sporogenes]
MEILEFRTPTVQYKNQAEAFKQEFFDYGETVINGSALLDEMTYDNWLANTLNNSSPKTVRSDWVVANTFFVIRKTDNKIIGIIDIRHNINNDFIAAYGGHIGYSVRPSERRKGYATQMLKMALEFERTIGLEKVMLGCYSDNIDSIKTIEGCGGIRSEEKLYIDKNPMYVYWILL